MALHELEVPTNAIDVTMYIDQGPEPRIQIAILHQEGVDLYSQHVQDIIDAAPIFTNTIDAQTRKSFLHPRAPLQISVDDSRKVAIMTSGFEGYSIHPTVESDGKDCIGNGVPTGGADCIVSRGPNSPETLHLLRVSTGSDFSHGQQNAVMSHTPSDFVASTAFTVSSLRVEAVSCRPNVQTQSNGDLADGDFASIDYIFSLSENGILFANDRCLVRNCTSFSVTPAHVIFTTTQNLIKLIHMRRRLEGLTNTKSIETF